ncbi:DM13 domain-containing protein [Hydrogenophaga sp. 5NK40-0174]|uniref:DM13 domain-containing protein n=1 Tax=Hydrogenophaga sp. 5NK40-0174 TaxID=3127649 RepID=UPI003103E955
MRLTKALLLLVSHIAFAAVGFAGGIYALPILTAPPSPTASEVNTVMAQAQFKAKFDRNRKDSDALHWGEGTVSVGPGAIALMGEIAPGPNYKLYLSPEFVETEADFKRLKAQSVMVQVGDVQTFKNFVVPVPAGIDPAKYATVIVWCESFEEFITSARYQP